ncbi:BcsR/BcsP family cellulose biosynthesis protein [Schauerella aestuarii]|uniref:BcsR/BcsP family cellulose biosynthesis protein n=1 Tax=Schauerella aestuarii TaxID=2511204 RepID=UPI00136A97BD|nr:BcsR/BcsP family cellulose biosynthesis protein [Achromobacter aestuarii]MYZ45838.1 hypothetical protein [Achromobacter aestuarii]
MSHSSDIANLYGHFDGNAVEYQESMQQSDAIHAKSRWPLLAATVFSSAAPPPVVRVTSATAATAEPASVHVTVASDDGTPVAERKAQFVAPRRKVLSSAALSDWATTTAATAPTEADVRIARQYETT